MFSINISYRPLLCRLTASIGDISTVLPKRYAAEAIGVAKAVRVSDIAEVRSRSGFRRVRRNNRFSSSHASGSTNVEGVVVTEISREVLQSSLHLRGMVFSRPGHLYLT
jgi:hypothetical protein